MESSEYDDAIQYWRTLPDVTKRMILERLERDKWDREPAAARYGDILKHIPIAQYQTELKRLKLSPRRTEEDLRDRVDATPLKDTLQRLSEQCSAEDAFAELIDNVFDNYARKRSEHKRSNLDVSIYFISQEGSCHTEILFIENSGGAKTEELIPLVRLGDSVTTGAPTIGAWGQGSKIACFALADEIEIFTHYPDQEPVCIHFPDGWLRRGTPNYKTWEVKIYRAEEVPEGSSVFRFCNLKRVASKAEPDRIAKYLQHIYSFKLEELKKRGIDVTIRIEQWPGGQVYELKPTFTLQTLENEYGFCWWPDYAPVEVTRTLESEDPMGGEIKLNVTLVAGILSRSRESLGGVYMYGNDRLFTPEPEQGENVAFGRNVQTRLGKIRTYGPPLYRLVAFLFFESEEGQSEYVPWSAPLKNRYNPNNLFHDEIMQFIYSVLYPYSRVCEGITEDMLPFFTAKWSQKGVSEKEDDLRTFFNDVPESIITKIAEVHSLDVDINNLRTYTYDEIQGHTDPPFGQRKSGKVKDFLKKLTDERYDIYPLDYLVAFFTSDVNYLVGEGLVKSELKMDLDPPDPAHLYMNYIEKRIEQATPQYETGQVKLDAEEKEQLIARYGLSDSVSVTQIAETVLSKVLEDRK